MYIERIVQSIYDLLAHIRNLSSYEEGGAFAGGGGGGGGGFLGGDGL